MEKLSKRFIATVLAVMTVLVTLVAGFSGTASAGNPDDLVGISISTEPVKTEYIVGETLDTTGMSLTEKFRDGSSQGVTSGYSCSPTKLDTVGTQVITVTYSGFSCTFTVEVLEKSSEITTTSTTIPAQTTTTVIYTTAVATMASTTAVDNTYPPGYTVSPFETTTKRAPSTTADATTARPAVPTTAKPVVHTTAPATRPDYNNEYALIVNAKKNELNYGQSTAVEAIVTPDIKGNLQIIWLSSDISVATVNQKGFVTACGEGEVIITAILVDENGRAVIDPYGDEISESVVIKCNMTIWQKIVRFFRNLFGGLFF